MANIRIGELPELPEATDSVVIPADNGIQTYKLSLEQLKEFIGSGGGVPIGTILSWTSDSSLPIGYLECLGQAVSRTTYDQLFAIIGTTFGVGDGSTTFNLPNGQALVLRGEGTQVVNGRSKDGGSLGDVLEDQTQKQTGSFYVHGDASSATEGAFEKTIDIIDNTWGGGTGDTDKIDFDSSDSPDARTSSTTAGETRVSSLSVIFIIRAENLSTADATTSAIDALNARVTDLETEEVPYIFVSDKVTRSTTETLACPSGSASVGNNKLTMTTEEGSSNRSTYFNFDNANDEIDVLVTGLYQIQFETCGYRLNRCYSALYNVTDSVFTTPAKTGYARSADDQDQITLSLTYTTTLTAGKSYALYTYAASTAGGVSSFGVSNTASAANFPAGNSSVWNWIKITKVG